GAPEHCTDAGGDRPLRYSRRRLRLRFHRVSGDVWIYGSVVTLAAQASGKVGSRFRLMKILVVNLHSSANAGDDVLTQETVRQLYAAFAGASVTLAMNDPDSYQGPAATVASFMAWVKRERRWRWWAFPGLLLLS